MNSPRHALLSTFFQILEEENVPYCVLRNYHNIYEDTTSDVDLVVEEEHVAKMRACLTAAASLTGHHFVLYARYVNFSYVYWHPEGGFVRIDLETEVRWRVFPILTAKAIITLRRKQGVFYIPHPRHEAAILYTAVIWRRFVSERYREQLARLYAQVSGPAELERTFRACFGKIGPQLAHWQGRVSQEVPSPQFWRAARRSLMWHAFRDGPTRREFFRYLTADIRRSWQRLRQPPGISLLYAANVHPPRNLEDFFQRIHFLFPVQKAVKHTYRVAPQAGEHLYRLGLRPRLRRLYSLFKGGLFIRCYEMQDDSDIRRVIQTHARYLYAKRAFIWSENSRYQTCLGNVETGFMAEMNPAEGQPVSNDAVIRFMAGVLEHHRKPTMNHKGRRGVFMVLVGLDGSGKTTVARQVCCLGTQQNCFRRIRYFHWQPRLFRNATFPLPDPRNLPRKQPQKRSLLGAALSTARLLKNLLLTNLAHQVRVRSLLRRNSLVLVDRYFYNYFLDPVSVKYYGPAWVLNKVSRLFPKPDLVVVLKAPPETLLARKQELSPEEIQHQSALLDSLEFEAGETLVVDAARPAPEIAQAIWDKAAQVSDRLNPPHRQRPA